MPMSVLNRWFVSMVKATAGHSAYKGGSSSRLACWITFSQDRWVSTLLGTGIEKHVQSCSLSQEYSCSQSERLNEFHWYFLNHFLTVFSCCVRITLAEALQSTHWLVIILYNQLEHLLLFSLISETAFKTPWATTNLFMPFGLTNGPAVFEPLINGVLRDMLNQFVSVCVIDILMFSRAAQRACQAGSPAAP